MQICSMAALETGSELLLGFDKDALFNIFLERIMSNDLEDHKYYSISIGGLISLNLRFPGDIVVNAEEADDIMDTTCTRYKMESVPDKKFFMPPTLKNLTGHIAFGACVRGWVGGCVGHTFLYLL